MMQNVDFSEIRKQMDEAIKKVDEAIKKREDELQRVNVKKSVMEALKSKCGAVSPLGLLILFEIFEKSKADKAMIEKIRTEKFRKEFSELIHVVESRLELFEKAKRSGIEVEDHFVESFEKDVVDALLNIEKMSEDRRVAADDKKIFESTKRLKEAVAFHLKTNDEQEEHYATA